MKIQATLIVNLPLKFTVGNQFKNTSLNNLKFCIKDVQFELLTNEINIINRVKIKLDVEYENSYLPTHENIKYLSEFYKDILYRAGTGMQSFLDGFSKCSNNEYYQIFDGDDFTTEYTFETTPLITCSSGNKSSRHLYLDDDALNRSVEFAIKSKDIFDNAWYVLRDAEHTMELGKYEISLINMAIMIELLVTSRLTKFLKTNGDFNNMHQDNINSIYGGKASFTQRYFEYGLSLITSKKLNKDALDAVDFIYKVRNKLAHGKNLYDIYLIKESGINEYNIRDTWRSLIYYSNDIYDYFYDL